MLEALWEVFKWAMFMLGCFVTLGAFVSLMFIWAQDKRDN